MESQKQVKDEAVKPVRKLKIEDLEVEELATVTGGLMGSGCNNGLADASWQECGSPGVILPKV